MLPSKKVHFEPCYVMIIMDDSNMCLKFIVSSLLASSSQQIREHLRFLLTYLFPKCNLKMVKPEKTTFMIQPIHWSAGMLTSKRRSSILSVQPSWGQRTVSDRISRLAKLSGKSCSSSRISLSTGHLCPVSLVGDRQRQREFQNLSFKWERIVHS